MRFIAALAVLFLVSVNACSPADEKKADKKDEKKLDPKLEEQIKSLKSKTSKDRIAALEALGKMGEDAEPAFRPICELLTTEANEKVLLTAVDILEKVNPTLGPLVTTIMVDKDENKRAEAIHKIGTQGDTGRGAYPVVTAYYRKAAAEKFPITGKIMVSTEAMVAIDPEAPETMKVLVAAMQLNLQGVGEKHPKSVLLGYISQLGMDHEKLKKQAITSLTAALKEKDSELKIKAIKLISGYGDDAKPALATLKQLKVDSNEDVRKAARAALEELEGK